MKSRKSHKRRGKRKNNKKSPESNTLILDNNGIPINPILGPGMYPTDPSNWVGSPLALNAASMSPMF